jgi:hypothetical protein
LRDGRVIRDAIELANELLAAWNNGEGVSKSELERKHWNDGSSHGRRFDRFIRQTLGIETARKSKQTDRIADLEAQVRGLGRSPVGVEPPEWELQLLHRIKGAGTAGASPTARRPRAVLAHQLRPTPTHAPQPHVRTSAVRQTAPHRASTLNSR